MEEQAWYRQGLRFECTQCGNCCTGAAGYVWVNPEEIKNLAVLLNLQLHEFRKRYVRKMGDRESLIELADGDCIFLDSQSRRCRVYAERPRQCRSWPFWDSNLRTPGDWTATCRVCPGSGQGDVVPLAEIEARRAEIAI
jgi:hypothetical protein